MWSRINRPEEETTMKLEGKAALITGAGSGIGRAIALLFAREGADVAVNDINASSAESTSEAIRAMGGKAIAIGADIADEKEVISMVSTTIRELNGLHILVNNAGIGGGGPLLESSAETWDRVMAVDLRGTYLCSREAGRWMAGHNTGKIVNISSIAALRAQINMSPYAAAKTGIISLTRTLAQEWAKYSINVNCIVPGGIDTPMSRGHSADLTPERIKQWIPLGRMGQPEDIAKAALFLVSDDASFITGIYLPVDGGELTRF
jgi:NAD(P)-dependent dehydrogenase (short-subunit alcohol dehydrogenase family)